MKDNKTVLNFEEKHHILEVDGVEYEIPQRTAELEEKIKEHDEKLPELTEYEGNMLLLEILFGKEKAHQMFPDGKNTNLDKLAKCTYLATELYRLEENAARDKDIENQTSPITALMSQLKDVCDVLKNIKEKDIIKNEHLDR